jgi:hypothetical protein
MGIRIEFYKNTTSQSLRELLDAHYESFKKDYVAHQSDEIKKYDLDAEDMALFGFLSIDPATKIDFEGLDQSLLDTLAFVFFRFRHDYFEPIGPAVYKKNYEASSGMVSATRDTELEEFWEILLHGRSIAMGHPWSASYHNTQLGFLSPDEQARFQEKIELYFGTVDLERYPAGTGLSCVLNVLQEIDAGKELLITVDLM